MRRQGNTCLRRVAIVATSSLLCVAATTLSADALTVAGGRQGQTVASTDPVTAVTDAPTTAAPPPTAAPPTAAPVTTPAGVPATTVPAAHSTSSSSTPWGAIVAAVLVIALLVALIARRRRRGATRRSWQSDAISALADATLVRDMLHADVNTDHVEDVARQTNVRDTVERTASRFEQLALTAPNDEAKRDALNVASSLRGYQFAIEAERLLRTGSTPPTGDQLASSDAARRTRAADLDSGIASLRSLAEPKGTVS